MALAMAILDSTDPEDRRPPAAAAIIRKRPARADPEARRVQQRPAAAPGLPSGVGAHPLGPWGQFEKPLLAGPAPSGDIGYASDCSGLDAGAFALRKLVTSFRHYFASEFEPSYRAILQATHSDVGTIYRDVSKRGDEELGPYQGQDTIYTSGFPCQPFAKSGAQQGHADHAGRGMLAFYVVMTIAKLLPDMFILENVPDLASDPKYRQMFDLILRQLHSAGDGVYNIYWRILNSKQFGVPAQRHRLCIVGLRRDRQWCSWSWPAPRPIVALNTVFDVEAHHGARPGDSADLASLPPFALENLARGLELIKKKYPQSDMDQDPWVIDIGVSKSRAGEPFLDEMPTITKARAGKRAWCITNLGRRISENELLRCQGFNPSDVVVPTKINREKLCEMVGNAFTVNVMQALMQNGLRALGRSDP